MLNFHSDFTWAAWVNTTVGGTIFAKCPTLENWARGAMALFIRNGQLAFDTESGGLLLLQLDIEGPCSTAGFLNPQLRVGSARLLTLHFELQLGDLKTARLNAQLHFGFREAKTSESQAELGVLA